MTRALRSADLSRVEAVFTDVDGTLTTGDRLRASTVRALEGLSKAGISVVLVSGRPAGWGEAWARQLPVAGVIVENGGVTFTRKGHTVKKRYAQPEAERLAGRKRLWREVRRALAAEPGARLSSDSAYTEVDLAIDWHEDARLEVEAAVRLEQRLRARGVQAVRSSVHVNCWVGAFDKRTAVEAFLAREWRTRLAPDDGRFVYVGDSFNDAPLFGAIPLSIGVANVRPLLAGLDHPPRFITRAEEGRGFEELARAVLRARQKRGPPGAPAV